MGRPPRRQRGAGAPAHRAASLLRRLQGRRGGEVHRGRPVVRPGGGGGGDPSLPRALRSLRNVVMAVAAYEVLPHVLTRLFTHTDETDEQLRVLVNAAIGLMAGVLRPLAAALTTLPVGLEHPGRTAGCAFEMYYLMGNLVPWREPAWALLHERAAVLVEHCTAVGAEAD